MPPALVQLVRRWGRFARFGTVVLAVGVLCGLSATIVALVLLLASVR